METKKEIYQQKMEAKLDQLNAQIDTYIAKFDENKADAKMEIQETIDNTDQSHQALKEASHLKIQARQAAEGAGCGKCGAAREPQGTDRGAGGVR